MKFSREVKRKRQLLGETQRQFGKRFGKAQRTVSQWEAGHTEIPNKVIVFVHECKTITNVVIAPAGDTANWYMVPAENTIQYDESASN